MKNTLYIIAALLVLFAFTQSTIIDRYIPTKKGSTFTYNQYDRNKNILGYLISEVTETTTSEKNTVSKIKQTFKGKNGDTTKIGFTEYKYENGSTFLSIEDIIPQQAIRSIEGMQGISITIDADDMEIPINTKKGDKLKDVIIKITAKKNGISLMTINAEVTNITCEGTEEITTPSGVYSCLVISNNTNINSGYMKNSAISKQWLAKGVGLVKIKNYKNGGHLVSSMELVKEN